MLLKRAYLCYDGYILLRDGASKMNIRLLLLLRELLLRLIVHGVVIFFLKGVPIVV